MLSIYSIVKYKNDNRVQMIIVTRPILRDPHWYIAIILAIAFWLVDGLLISSFQPYNLFADIRLLVLAVFVYPILEEVVFRGGIQSWLLRSAILQRAYFRISAANVITSVLFALFHLVNQSWYWAILVFFPSLIFGYFKDRYGNIHASIILHVFYNAGFLALFAG